LEHCINNSVFSFSYFIKWFFTLQENNSLKKFELVCTCCSGSTSEIYDLAWSPDSQFLIFGSIDNTTCVWDVVRGTNCSNDVTTLISQKTVLLLWLLLFVLVVHFFSWM
jgi:WD40 repeat protein